MVVLVVVKAFFSLVYSSCSCGGVCQSNMEQLQPFPIQVQYWKLPLSSGFPSAAPEPRRPPITLTFWVPSEAQVLGSGLERSGGPDTEGLSDTSKRYRPSLCPVVVLASCHRNCCWMWAPSRQRSQWNSREFQCGWLWEQKPAHSLVRGHWVSKSSVITVQAILQLSDKLSWDIIYRFSRVAPRKENMQRVTVV